MPAKLTLEFIKQYFKDRGCKLLETEYINSHTKMKYLCKNGHNNEIIFSSFQRGIGCSICSGKKKHTFEEVFNYFKDNNCKLLEIEYINIYTKMKYICENGHISEIRFNDFKQGRRCSKCY